MSFYIFLIFLVNICPYTTSARLPSKQNHQGHNTQDNLPYGGWGGSLHNPSGGSPGAYYGTGHNPNFGHFQPVRNDAEHSIGVVNYNHLNSNSDQQQQQQQLYNLNNNYISGQRPNTNYYYYPYNRFPAGSQGWYAGGNNYWYNKGQSINSHAWLFIISMVILLICI